MKPDTELKMTLFQKIISQKLDELLTARNVPKDTRDALINSLEMMYEYIPYVAKQHGIPSDRKLLNDFLSAKGKKMVKFAGNDRINCIIALLDFLDSSSKAVKLSSGAAAAVLPVPVLAWGLATLDLIEVGNSCEFVQEATYHIFIKENSLPVKRARAVVNQAYARP